MNQRERALYEAALNLGMKDADAAFYAAEAYGREIRYAEVPGGERDIFNAPSPAQCFEERCEGWGCSGDPCLRQEALKRGATQ